MSINDELDTEPRVNGPRLQDLLNKLNSHYGTYPLAQTLGKLYEASIRKGDTEQVSARSLRELLGGVLQLIEEGNLYSVLLTGKSPLHEHTYDEEGKSIPYSTIYAEKPLESRLRDRTMLHLFPNGFVGKETLIHFHGVLNAIQVVTENPDIKINVYVTAVDNVRLVQAHDDSQRSVREYLVFDAIPEVRYDEDEFQLEAPWEYTSKAPPTPTEFELN